MREYTLDQPIRNVTNSFVGTFGCWIVGIGLAVVAVLFAVSGGLLVKLIGLALLLVAAVLCGFARTASAQWKLRLTALSISLCLALVVAEVALRAGTNFPVNSVSNMIPHAELGYVLDPGLSDVDERGFRNPAVLEQADIVTIGDSHTQGFNAASAESWPQVLGAELGRSVYNMGVGGYGPLQYEQLVSLALRMQPQDVVVGLYLGNDLGDVTRGLHERCSEEEVDNHFRHTLKYHTATGSALSQLITRSSLCRPSGCDLNHAWNPTYVAKQRVCCLSSEMNLADPPIAAAFQKTTQMLTLAQQQCAAQGVRLTVLLIPTRESVYCNSEHELPESLPDAVNQLVSRETELRNRFHQALREQKISFVDALPSLVTTLDSATDVYSAHDDGHPLAAGYRAYANAVMPLLSKASAVPTN